MLKSSNLPIKLCNHCAITVQWTLTAPSPLYPLELVEVFGLPSTIRTCDLRLRRVPRTRVIAQLNPIIKK